ncbi:MAG: tRNA N6-adenosine threonylcarbamoyltransferase [Hyphomicrobiaceae bacterium hypho_1]
MHKKKVISKKNIIILGIETSCDETASAIVTGDAQGVGKLLSNVIRSQWEHHYEFGGVVPEIAARAHVECIDEIITMSIEKANIKLSDVDAIAATAGPGLIGGLLVGLTTAKALAFGTQKPFIAVNHLEAHALTVGLTHGLAPPYMLLLVSGGHTQTVLVEAFGNYYRIGTTIDDAVGEAFDKTAKLLNIGFPGGPAVEQHARNGDPFRFKFPKPLKGRAEPHFSFSGLKSALRRRALQLKPLTVEDIADLCAGFEHSVCEVIQDRVMNAYDVAKTVYGYSSFNLPLVAAGGVACNQSLRRSLDRVASKMNTALFVPPPALCSDNGAMVAWAGLQHYSSGSFDELDFAPRPRWPLDVKSKKIYGFGKHGAKA